MGAELGCYYYRMKYLLLLALLAFACSKSEHPNILLITLDTVRSDYIGCYGRHPGLTPHADALADRGVRFAYAVAPSPITLPSHVSVLTGQYPVRHGVRDNSVYFLDEGAVTLAEALKSAGYETRASVASIALSHRFGVAQGFDGFEEGNIIVEDGQKQGVVERDGKEIAEEVIQFLRRAGERPFFYWAHFYDPHEPYIWHDDIDPGPAKTQYACEVRYADLQVGRILDELQMLGLDESTVVVLTADHGEGLGQHNERTHLVLTYETTLSVPLIVAGPGIARGQVVEKGMGRLIDIMPTLLDVADVGAPSEVKMDGVSLRPLLESGNGAAPDIAYFETMGPVSFDWSPLDGVTTGEWKLIRGPTDELYRLPDDPGELIELQEKHPQIMAELARAADTCASIASETGGTMEMAGRQSELFGALGYLSLDARSRRPSRDAPHPRDMVGILDLLNFAHSAYSTGQYDQALTYYERCLALSPGTAMFHEAKGKTLRRMARNEEAIAAFRKALEIHPEMIDARLILGIACVNTGDVAAGEREFRETIRRAPELHKGYAYLANLMRQENRPDEELKVLEAMFEQTSPPETEARAFRQEMERLKQQLGEE